MGAADIEGVQSPACVGQISGGALHVSITPSCPILSLKSPCTTVLLSPPNVAKRYGNVTSTFPVCVAARTFDGSVYPGVDFSVGDIVVFDQCKSVANMPDAITLQATGTVGDFPLVQDRTFVWKDGRAVAPVLRFETGDSHRQGMLRIAAIDTSYVLAAADVNVTFLPCPVGSRRIRAGTGPDAYRCELCPADSYSSDNDSAWCRTCASLHGAQCVPSAAGDRNILVAQAGYWIHRPDSGGDISVLECVEGFCRGHPSSAQTHSQLQECTSAFVCNRCAFGHENSADNFMCGRCSADFSLWGGQCVSCGAGVRGDVIFMWIVALWALALFQHVCAQRTTAPAKTLLSFGQIAATVGARGLYIDVVGADAGRYGPCPFPRSYVHAVYTSIGSFALLLALHGCTFALSRVWLWIVQRRRKMTTVPESAMFSGAAFVRSLLMIVVFGSSTLLDAAVNSISCSKIGGRSVLSSAPSIDCTSAEYRAMRPVYATVLAIVVLLPLVLVAWLLRLSLLGVLFHSDNVRRYGSLYEAYRRPMFWFDAVFLVRRMTFVMLYVYLTPLNSSSPAIRDVIIFFVSVAFIVLHVTVRPFQEARANRMEALSLGTLCVLASLQAVRTALSFSNTSNLVVSVLYFVLLLGCLTALVANVAIGLWPALIWLARKCLHRCRPSGRTGLRIARDPLLQSEKEG